MKKSILAITLMFALVSCGAPKEEATATATDSTAVVAQADSACCDTTAVVDTTSVK